MPKVNKPRKKIQGIRVYELAKELKLDNKKVIEDARREGIDVNVPSNVIPHAFAEKIRGKYFPTRPQRDMRPRLIKANREYIALAQLGDKIRVVSLKADGTYSFLDEAENPHSIIYLANSEALRLQEKVEELEWLVNNPKVKEKDFQEFFNRNQNFILNDEYRRAHSHIVLSEDSYSPLIPDFVLEPYNQRALCDLLELKLPSSRIFTLKPNRDRFSSAVSDACAQLRKYRDFFDEEKNRIQVHDKYGLRAFRPKMFVIIGRRGTLDPIEVRKIETDTPNLHLRTYDDLIDKVKSKVEAIRQGRY
jgi:hypothetical protein